MMGHVPGEQEKMPEGEEREEAKQILCSQGPGPPQGMVHEDRNMQAAGDMEMRLGLSRGDED